MNYTEKLSPNEQMNERILTILSAYFQQRGSFLAQVIRCRFTVSRQ
jgi:hypothetical protein